VHRSAVGDQIDKKNLYPDQCQQTVGPAGTSIKPSKFSSGKEMVERLTNHIAS